MLHILINRRSIWIFPLFLLLFVILVTAGLISNKSLHTDLSIRQERVYEPLECLDRDHSFSQKFIAEEDYLRAIHFFITVHPDTINENSGFNLFLHLRRDTHFSENLASSTISIPDSPINQTIVFQFPIQRDSANNTYYLIIETDAPPNTISIAGNSTVTSYNSGESIKDEGTNQDIGFRLYYKTGWSYILYTFLNSYDRIILLIGFTIFFGLLGKSFLFFLNIDWKVSSFEYMALSIACGITIPPVIVFLLNLLGIRINALNVKLFLSTLIFLVTVLLFKRKNSGLHHQFSIKCNAKQPLNIHEFILFILFTIALAVAAAQINNVYVPLWVDGLTNTENVSRVITDGGFPSNTLYHIGFHINVAFLNLVTGIPLPELTLLMGQWLVVIFGLTSYLFVRWMTNKPLAACSSAVCLWFFASLPGYLVNWGRYPFLQGITLIPIITYVLIESINRPSRNSVILSLFLILGVFLSHYGTITIIFSLLISIELSRLFTHREETLNNIRYIAAKIKDNALILFISVVVSTAAIAIRIAPHIIDGRILAVIEESRKVSENIDIRDILRLHLRSGGTWLWVVGVFGIFYADIKERLSLKILGGWIIIQWLLVAIQKPFFGEAVASYTNLAIILSLPMSVMAGLFLDWLISKVFLFIKSLFSEGAPGKNILRHIASIHINHWFYLVLLLLVFFGAPIQIGLVSPTTILFSKADQEAMQWLKSNTPSDALFLINSNYWGNFRVVPSDGGGWIPLTTERSSIFLKEENENISAFIEENHIDYVYVGSSSGFLSNFAKFALQNEYELVYNVQGIRIYKVS